jgi:hypothetical protein
MKIIMNIINEIQNCREMTHEELKKEFRKKTLENENLKITNELLLKNIKELRQEAFELEERNDQLMSQFSSAKEAKLEEKKERLFNND